MKVRLDGYNRFVVERFMDLFESDSGHVLDMIMFQWTTGNTRYMQDAGASLSDWKFARARDAPAEPPAIEPTEET